ncbi:MAG: hypothetical protein R3E44_07005 [Paracoccaceae bacterium]
MQGVSGWVPYVEVDDLPAAAKNARNHGAEIIAENLKGPTGDASFTRDTGGAPLAQGKRGLGM